MVKKMQPKLVKFIDHIKHVIMVTDGSIKFRNECKWSVEDEYIR